VLHRCRLGGPPEIETVVYGSATALAPATTVARCLPAVSWTELEVLMAVDASEAFNNDNSASLPTFSPRPSTDGGSYYAAADAASSLASTDSRKRFGRPMMPPQHPQQQQIDGALLKSDRSNCSSLGSSAWLASLASEQALLDCERLWTDKPEYAVRGGQRKGAGSALARPMSYPANLSGAGDRSHPLGRSCTATAGALPAAAAAAGPRRSASLVHAASAPSATEQFGLAAACEPPRCAPAVRRRCSVDSATGELTHVDSMDSKASVGSEGTVHGGEAQEESMERCVRAGTRRRNSLRVSESGCSVLGGRWIPCVRPYVLPAACPLPLFIPTNPI